MKKEINFPPYTEAVVKDILEDGTLICDLFGEGFTDTNVGFPPGNPYLELTPEEVEQVISERKIFDSETNTL